MSAPEPFASPRLNAMLDMELAAGNRVVEEHGPGFADLQRLVFLCKPFMTPTPAPGAHLQYRELNDPHWWKAEVFDPTTKEVLACKFG